MLPLGSAEQPFCPFGAMWFRHLFSGTNDSVKHATNVSNHEKWQVQWNMFVNVLYIIRKWGLIECLSQRYGSPETQMMRMLLAVPLNLRIGYCWTRPANSCYVYKLNIVDTTKSLNFELYILCTQTADAKRYGGHHKNSYRCEVWEGPVRITFEDSHVSYVFMQRSIALNGGVANQHSYASSKATRKA
jgi:hypothetical protein